MGKRAETIERIIQSARELFWESGYRNVTTQEIADKAGITKGLLTHYFAQKNDIVSSINYQDFMRIYNYADHFTNHDSFLNYLITLYTVRKSFTVQPQLRAISEDAFASVKAERNREASRSHDSIYIDIIQQFNINMTLEDLRPKVIMANGAASALAKFYYSGNSNMSLDDYLRQSVLVTGTLFEIPYIIRTQYYEKAMEIIASGVIPEFNYLKNNYVYMETNHL